MEEGQEVRLEGCERPGLVTRDGLMIPGTDGAWLVVRLLSVQGKFVKAHEFGQQEEGEEELSLTGDETNMVERVRQVWASILKINVEDDTDFFGAGAGSMDVVRLIEEVGSIALMQCFVYCDLFFSDCMINLHTSRSQDEMLAGVGPVNQNLSRKT